MRKRAFRTRAAVVGVAAAVVVTAGYGFTAANTVPASKAGDGSGAISGYAVSGIDYTLLASDPTKLDKVDFDLDSAPAGTSQIKVRLSGTWYDCTNAGTAVTCDFGAGSEPTVVGATSLQVVVAD